MAESKRLERIDNHLVEHYNQIKGKHLRELLQDGQRVAALKAIHDNIMFDYSHEKVTTETLQHFEKLVQDANLWGKIEAMFNGEKINKTEDRSVLHVALRMRADQSLVVGGQDVVKEVHEVLNRIQAFAQKIRDGEIKGATGKALKNVVTIGIGGSYLGIEFVYEAFRTQADCRAAAADRKIRFLANVDPIDFARATDGLNVEETLFVIISKTFTTAETMLNARSSRNWIFEQYRKQGQTIANADDEKKFVNAHMCAVSTNLPETSKFGISDDRVFGFWDWVGGRFSVCSAVGILPLSLHFGFDNMRKFLNGANNIDDHFRNTKTLTQNIPLLLGLLGYYHNTVQNYNARAILPYCQALCKFAPHIQQLDMESNGKRVSVDGQELAYETGVVNFGEPGTNGQHSFYQLLHQGRAIPCEFIGFCRSQFPVALAGEPVVNHDELMSNFFSQPDALAYGKNTEELVKEKVPEKLLTHKFFPGDRPSLSLLFDELNPYTCGQLLAIYEHRTAVEGFLWNINSFDQWGVELGKALAKDVRTFFQKNAGAGQAANFQGFTFNPSTQSQLSWYLSKRS